MMKYVHRYAQLGSVLTGALLYAVGLQLPFFSYDLQSDSGRLSVADFRNLVVMSGTDQGALPAVLVLLIAAAVAIVSRREVRRAARMAAVLSAIVSLGLLLRPVIFARSELIRYGGDGFAVPPGPGFTVLTIAVLLLAASPFVAGNHAGRRTPVDES